MSIGNHILGLLFTLSRANLNPLVLLSSKYRENSLRFGDWGLSKRWIYICFFDFLLNLLGCWNVYWLINGSRFLSWSLFHSRLLISLSLSSSYGFRLGFGLWLSWFRSSRLKWSPLILDSKLIDEVKLFLFFFSVFLLLQFPLLFFLLSLLFKGFLLLLNQIDSNLYDLFQLDKFFLSLEGNLSLLIDLLFLP